MGRGEVEVVSKKRLRSATSSDDAASLGSDDASLSGCEEASAGAAPDSSCAHRTFSGQSCRGATAAVKPGPLSQSPSTRTKR
jgi:hypothetical protein